MTEDNNNTSPKTISELGEFGLIDKLTENIRLTNPNTVKGVGDDAAVIDTGSNYLLVTKDLLLEGIHFDMTYQPLRHLGYKAVVVNLSDICAMNGTPTHIVVGIGFSSRYTLEAIEEIYEGMRLACEKFNVDFVGGDTTSSVQGLVISVTAMGTVEKDMVTYRGPAAQNELLCVSGDLGGAYAGLLILEREKAEFKANPNMQPNLGGNEYVLERFLKPEPRQDIVRMLKDLKIKPTAMIDISDGLASEIKHICKHSDLGCTVFEEKIPMDQQTYDTARSFDMDPTMYALNGGEDYELLFTIAQSDFEKIKNIPDITVIGHMTDKNSGINLVAKSGAVVEIKAQGWDHMKKMNSLPSHTDRLKTLIKTLPDNPGVYQFLDEKSKIIYVGKAKSLKKRVASYFNKDSSLTGKTSVMVKNIHNIRHIIVNTELDALLLENNLIKKYQPRYNVNLKDDKSFPWICIKNERFPRIFPTRNLVRDGSSYFGPYASVRMMNTLLDLVRQLYPLRNCKLNLSEKNIENGKFKVCLEYHLGNCKGPCEGLQSEEDYIAAIEEIKEIIKGNISTVLNSLRALMKKYADEMAFEKAHTVKEKIELLEKYQSKSMVVNPRIHNVDVFSIISDANAGYVNWLRVINGAIVQAHTIEMKKKLDESDKELLTIAITEFRQRFESDAHEVIVPVRPGIAWPDTTYTVPKIGDKKQLLELSERNARYYLLEKQKQQELVDPERHTKRILSTLKKDLHLPELPAHIECFDNSNMLGDYPVAAMVCFKDARPSKKDYRHFNIKTVEGPNDYASMEEVIYRRYKRLMDEEQPLPQLIVIDGGKGQLSSAVASLEKLGLRGKISIIGIAKRLEELYFPDDPIPLHIDKKSETLKVIQYLRDEAHRFGIMHYRKKHQKGTIKSTLTDIEGIGKLNAQKLLSKFKSVKKIRNASLEELQAAIGKTKGMVVYDYFKKNPEH